MMRKAVSFLEILAISFIVKRSLNMGKSDFFKKVDFIANCVYCPINKGVK
jgi:hypothetical protein